MDLFSNKADSERQVIFQEAANSRGVTPIIIEKDFWVCWTLKRLYECPELASYLTFKGGTSLSKAFGLIERFSEDIDLTISRTAPYVREVENPMAANISGKERKRRIDALKQNAQRFVEGEALPNLIEAIRQTLGQSDGWEVVLDESDPEQQTLLFHYPKTLNYGATFPLRFPVEVGGYIQPQIKLEFGARGEIEPNESKLIRPYVAETFPLRFPVEVGGYIQPQIKLEFGARGEIEPNESKLIRPYVAETFPQLFTDVAVQVSTLAAERSFWEKATILHALHHGSRQRDRMSRHYYDTYMMAERGVADSALANTNLLEQVVRNKSLLFSDNSASYETARIGSLRLVPGEELLTSLSNDYQAMSEMFMGDVPAFKEIISRLRTLENRINQPD